MKLIKAILAMIIIAILFIGFLFLIQYAFNLDQDILKLAAQTSVFFIIFIVALFLVKAIIFINADIETLVNQRIVEVLKKQYAKKEE